MRTIIKKDQPIVYEVLRKAFEKNMVSHAYLFVGEEGSYQVETAHLLAQSIFCKDKSELACEVCDDCIKTKAHTNLNMIYIDGSKNSIKKEEILNIQREFNKTAEDVNKVYIINAIENATLEALNSLLKFLEEPVNTYAILITYDKERLLPTIISRCNSLNFKSGNFLTSYNESLKNNLDEIDAYLLSRIYKNYNKVIDEIESDIYITAKEAFMNHINEYITKPDLTLLNNSLLIFRDSNSEQREVVRLLFRLLIVFFEDVIGMKNTKDSWYNARVNSFEEINISKHLMIVIEQIDKINKYNNLQLLLEQTYYRFKEVKNEQ